MIFISQEREIFLPQLELMAVLDNLILEIYNIPQFNTKHKEEDQS